jgi:hypothetical protein
MLLWVAIETTPRIVVPLLFAKNVPLDTVTQISWCQSVTATANQRTAVVCFQREQSGAARAHSRCGVGKQTGQTADRRPQQKNGCSDIVK